MRLNSVVLYSKHIIYKHHWWHIMYHLLGGKYLRDIWSEMWFKLCPFTSLPRFNFLFNSLPILSCTSPESLDVIIRINRLSYCSGFTLKAANLLICTFNRSYYTNLSVWGLLMSQLGILRSSSIWGQLSVVVCHIFVSVDQLLTRSSPQ